MRPARVGVGVALAVLLAAPAAAAVPLLVPLHEFSGTLAVPDYRSHPPEDTAKEDSKGRVGIATGDVSLEGTAAGLFSLTRSGVGLFTGVKRVEVYDTTGTPDAIDPALYIRIGRPVHAVIDDAIVIISTNASYHYYTAGGVHKVIGHANFAYGIPLIPPDNLTRSFVNLDVNQSLAVVGKSILSLEKLPGTPDAFLFLDDANATVTVTPDRAGAKASTYPGRQYLFRLNGTHQLTASGDSLLLPLDRNLTATFAPAPARDLAGTFDLERLNQALAEATGNGSRGGPAGVPNETRDFVNALSPVFNGALFGNPAGAVLLPGGDHALGRFTLYRYETLRFSPGDAEGDVAYSGTGRLLLVESGLYTEKSVVGSGALRMPALSLALWVLAGLALVLARVRGPLLAPSAANAALPVRKAALWAHVGGLVAALWLWDLEVRAFLGTSLLGLLLHGGAGSRLAVVTIAALQLLPFGLAYGYFGLPMRYLANSLLALAHMKRARGVGRGIGYVSTWGLGAAYLPAMLGPFIGLLVGRLG